MKFPASLRTIKQCAFCQCKSLKYAKFADGLEVLGADTYPPKDSNARLYYGVFGESALEYI